MWVVECDTETCLWAKGLDEHVSCDLPQQRTSWYALYMSNFVVGNRMLETFAIATSSRDGTWRPNMCAFFNKVSVLLKGNLLGG